MIEGDYDPYESLLRLHHEVEQLQYQMQHYAAVIEGQSAVIQQLAKHLIDLDKKLEEL